MAFISSVPEQEAVGAVAAQYEADRQSAGFLPNYSRAFSLRPEVYAAWRQLNGAIKSTMPPRRYELATVAAARRLHSSYCALAHGSILVGTFVDADTLRAAMSDHHDAGLDPVDVAVMDLADKVAADATAITPEDLEPLRGLGLGDGEIMDVVLAATARCFFSKTLDALGVQADATYAELDPSLRDALTVGRPIEGG